MGTDQSSENMFQKKIMPVSCRNMYPEWPPSETLLEDTAKKLHNYEVSHHKQISTFRHFSQSVAGHTAENQKNWTIPTLQATRENAL